MIKPGSLAAQIDHRNTKDETTSVSASAMDEQQKLEISIPSSEEVGNYRWEGKVFANDMATDRPLTFTLSDQSYSVLEAVDDPGRAATQTGTTYGRDAYSRGERGRSHA